MSSADQEQASTDAARTHTKVQLKKPPRIRSTAAMAKESDSPKPMTERQLDRLLITTIGFLPILSLALPQGKDDVN